MAEEELGAVAGQPAAETPAPTETQPTPAAAPDAGGVADSTSQQVVDTQPSAPAGEPAPHVPQAQPGEHRGRDTRTDRRNRQLNDENRKLREQIARLEGRFDEFSRGAQPANADDDPEPDPNNFPGGELGTPYLRAIAAWDRRQERKRDEAQARERETRLKRESEIQENAKRYHTVRQRGAQMGLENGVDLLETLVQQGNYDFVDDITDMDYAPNVAEYLAYYPQEAERIAALAPRKRVAALSRIDDYIHAEIQKQRRAQSGDGAAAQPSAQAQAPSTATPKPKPQPTPKLPNGNASAMTAGDGGYDQLFRK